MATDLSRHVCGCYYTTLRTGSFGGPPDILRHYLPQVELSSHVILSPLSFKTTLTQTFINTLSSDLPETRYTFPLYDGVAVTIFTCTVGHRVLTGRVEEKEQARQTFTEASERGETAGLLESLPSGIFAVTLGNIPAKASIVVNITYGGELQHDAQIDGLRFTFPTSIAPRYGTYPGELRQPDTVSQKRGMRITVDMDMCGSVIRKIQTPSEKFPISVTMGNLSKHGSNTSTEPPTFQPSQASVTLSQERVELGNDFVLQIAVDDIGSPKAVLEKHPALPGHTAIMATLVPRFNLVNTKSEIVFIADQSGSMQGGKNRSLVVALTIFLKSLPRIVLFNVCVFGSSHRFLWEKSQAYTKDNVAEAIAFVQGLSADLGGTEIYRPLEATFEKHIATNGTLPLDIILLTDGETWQETMLFSLIHKHINEDKVDARVFALGIGSDVSHTLVQGVARAGNGFAQFVTENEPMEQKVIRMLKASLFPHTSKYTVELKYAEEDDDYDLVDDNKDDTHVGETAELPEIEPTAVLSEAASRVPISLFDPTVNLDDAIPDSGEPIDDQTLKVPPPVILQAPHVLPALFPSNRTTVFLLLANGKIPETITLRATSSQGPLELEIPVKALAHPDKTIHALAARKVSQELEEGRGWLFNLEDKDAKSSKRSSDLSVKKEIVRLGVTYQIANSECSFVAVEDKAGREVKTGDAVTSPVPDPQVDSYYYAAMADVTLRADARSVPMTGSKKKRLVNKSKPAAGTGEWDVSSTIGGSGFAGGPPIAYRAPSGLLGAATPATSAHHSAFRAFAPPAAPGASPGLFGAGSSTASRQSSLADSRARALRSSSVLFGAATQSLGQSVFAHNRFSASGNAKHPRSAPPQSDIEKVRQIIALQAFEGYWEVSTTLSNLLGVGQEGIRDVFNTEDVSDIGEEVLVTTIVLVFLETKMGSEKEVWEMVAQKGMDWLSQHITTEKRQKLEQLVKGKLL